MRINKFPPPPDPGRNLPVPVAGPLDVNRPRDYYYTQAPEPDPADDPNSGTLLAYWNMLRRRKGMLVLAAALGAIAALLFTLPQTRIYQARLVLEIQGLNENFLNMQSVNPNSNTNSYYPEYDVQTQVQILQSDTLRSQVVKKLSLDTRPLIASETRLSAWRKALGLNPPPQVNSRENAVAAASVHVRPQTNTRLIEISADSSDPQLAADFANTLASEFAEQNLQARWQSAQTTGKWLTGQMEDLKIKLEKSEDGLTAFARESGLLFTDEKSNVAEQKLKQLQEELSKAQADRVSRQSRYELATRASSESLPEVLDDPALKDYQSKLTDLRRQRAELASTYTSSNPKLKKIDAQLAVISVAADRAGDNILRRIRNEFETAQRREKLLAADYATQTRLMAGQADKVAHYNILKREVDTNRQLYDNMLQRVKEAGITSALRASTVRIVDPAKVPGGPYKPDLPKNVLIGLLAGTFLGVALVVFRERANRAIEEPGDAPFYTGVPELGVIPSGKAGRRLSNYYGRRRSQGPIGDAFLTTGRGAPATSSSLSLSAPSSSTASRAIELASLHTAPSLVAESFRALVTSIMFSGDHGAGPRVLVLTSANPREGKSTAASNLAIAFARINHRVLLIDGDLRRPRVHTIFGLENTQGFSDILGRPGALNGDPLHIRQTEVPNLSVLTSGSTADTGLLYSPRMAQLLERLREQYDMVVIDTPPMLQMSDARVIGRHADGVILVIRSRETTRDAARIVTQRFAEDGTRILGTLLNDWNPGTTSAYGYNKYYDHYEKYYGSKR